jgi:hypothetical protein
MTRPKRFPAMLTRSPILLALPALALTLAGCERKQPESQPEESPAVAHSEPGAIALPEPQAPASESAAPRAKLDMGALNERRDPDRLLRFYAAALHARDWSAAAKAWGAESGVTAATLRDAYDRPDRPTLELGKGQVEGAAGSLYYEAPVTLRFGGESEAERGTLTLRRVNDVPGATPDQLRWHIERVAIGVGQ